MAGWPRALRRPPRGWADRGGPRIDHGRAGRIVVVDLVTGRVVFSTSRWMGDDTDTVYVAIPKRFSHVYRPHDRTPVRVAACDLPRGTCTTLARLRGLTNLVLGPGPEA